MIIKTILFLIIPLVLFSLELKDTYFVEDRTINLSNITNNSSDNFLLTNIDDAKTLKRIKTKDLITILEKYGYKDITSTSPYITFALKSHIDTSAIKEALIEYFKNKYEHIDIKDITITPRGYMDTLPKEYEFETDKNTYLLRNSTINIKTPQNRKYFFDYNTEAYIDVYISKTAIKKGTPITLSTFTKKRILLERLKDMPIIDIETTAYEANKQLSSQSILTTRDVVRLKLVKRGSTISVSYNEDDMNISFSAKALQDGRANDIIRAQNSNNKIIRVKVIGENMAVAL